MLLAGGATLPRSSGELRFCLHGAPKSLDPLETSDSSGEIIRMLTQGALVRLDRRTQQLTPELASSWRVLPGDREIEFTLRPGTHFSDGSPVTPADVVFTMHKLLDPSLHSPAGDLFRFERGTVTVRQKGERQVFVSFPKPVSQLATLFDGTPILSAKTPGAVAGGYMIANYKAGSEILLHRNPYYWKKDGGGNPLPYISDLRIRIQPNREIEMLDFERGDIDLIPELTPELAERLAAKNPGTLVDLGLTLDSLLLWFNQVPTASLPAYKKAWFQSDVFRKSLSLAVNREDLCRIAYLGKAKPGIGPVSPANKAWFNPSMKADPYNPADALKRLQAAGFALRDGQLYDGAGNKVEFAAMTNAGNKTHERVLGLLQQDWKKIGVRLTVVTLDFPSLIERITRTFNYEVAMLPLTNIGIDPSQQMNIWLSSSTMHSWNPNQTAPATAWEKEIDERMGEFTRSVRPQDRKAAFDRVQQIVSERVPFLYLVHPQAQGAVASSVKLTGAPMFPYLLWGLETATLRR